MPRRTRILSDFNRLAVPRRRSRPRLPALVLRWTTIVVLATLVLPGPLHAAQAVLHATLPPPSSISLRPSLPSPQPLGTRITWTASASDTVPLVYRFGVATAPSGPYTVTRDFSAHNTVVWTPLQEGTYYIQVTLKEGYAGTSTVSRTASYTVTSRVRGRSPVVSRTVNPLVALYSAPPCASGQVTVKFRAYGATAWTSTNTEPCLGGLSCNFLVAGMLPSTTYQMVNVLATATAVVTSTPLYFTTGRLPASLSFPSIGVPQPPGPQTDLADGLVYHVPDYAASPSQASPVVADLQGRIMWYANQTDISYAPVRIQQVGGEYGDIVFLQGSDQHGSPDLNVLRAIDLAGDPLQETNVQAINQQLTARGRRIIYGFNHDAVVLPNGDTAVLAYDQATITTTSIQGDMLIVLDPNWQVAWTWDAFDHLDPYRGPTLGETCGSELPPGRCPVPGGPSTIDWTHTNSIDWSSTDNNIVMSMRNQDWVIKVNYANGSGDGSVLWRMGPGGDFSIVPLNPSDPYPWFSHQHDANYIDPTTLEVFDDGNTRCATLPPPCNSRGQVYEVNEATRVVTQTVNVDLGNYSPANGIAQRLSNGNYNFSSGEQLAPPPPHGQAIEVLPDGTKTYVQQISVLEYRAWRLATMDSPTNPPCPVCNSSAATRRV